ncbi:MAG: HAD-IC family P-type ATPase [bacterium]|nr:HAD-IC family P-type ATPase [bacterium]
MESRRDILWYTLTPHESLGALDTRRDGLHSQEVRDRQKEFGPNALPEKKQVSSSAILWAQFKSPLVFVLLFAAVVTLVLREWVDFGVVSAAVVINTIVGFIQELKADRSVEQLRRMVQIQARVVRGGTIEMVPAAAVVPGDILSLTEGDRLPADARILEANELETEEASLTGESAPVRKQLEKLAIGTTIGDRTTMVFAGTSIGRGTGRAVVVATGTHTEIGKLSQMVSETHEGRTPLQTQLAKLSRALGIIVGVIVIALVAFGSVRGFGFVEIFLTAVAVAVAAIPEGLLVSLTVILAIGMQRILKKKALVRKLVAAETLGSVSVICTDKTGTLTEGKMQVVHIVTEVGEGKPDGKIEHHVRALRIAVLANDATVKTTGDSMEEYEVMGEPTDRALMQAGMEAGLDPRELVKREDRVAEIPFDYGRKYMATLHAEGGVEGSVVYMKGAPEVLLGHSTAHDATREKWLHQADALTAKGWRVLGVAQKRLRHRLTELHEDTITAMEFVGLIALQDPLRPEARETIALCRAAGIHTVLITGDHKLTAEAIAAEAGILVSDHRIVEGKELDGWTDAELRKHVEHITVYARVEPRHKLRIVGAWQALGEVVAMTGDGVNDAPALKAADVGIAFGSGSDVTKETADVVLLDNNFKTIVAAVEQGRIIFANIRKVVAYLLSDSFSEMILIGGSLLMGLPLPLLPAQILWINLITDGFPSLALTVEPSERDVMSEKPRKRSEPILNREIKSLIFIIGVLTDLGLFALFFWLLNLDFSIEYIRTMMFVALGIDSLFYVFAIRSLRNSIFTMNPFANRWLIGAVGIGFALQFISIYWGPLQSILRTQSLNLVDWSILIGVSAVKLFMIEAAKAVFRFLERVRREVVQST